MIFPRNTGCHDNLCGKKKVTQTYLTMLSLCCLFLLFTELAEESETVYCSDITPEDTPRCGDGNLGRIISVLYFLLHYLFYDFFHLTFKFTHLQHLREYSFFIHPKEKNKPAWKFSVCGSQFRNILYILFFVIVK